MAVCQHKVGLAIKCELNLHVMLPINTTIITPISGLQNLLPVNYETSTDFSLYSKFVGPRWSLFLVEHLYKYGIWEGVVENGHRKDTCYDETELCA